MKNLLLILVAGLLLSCQNNSSGPKPPTVPKKQFPAELTKVFDAHGGFSNWEQMKSLSYEIVKEQGNEVQKIDLHNRRERIEASSFTMGYDGNDIWLEADTSYKSNPVFYKNLMFYFYAMPFVVGDEGIVYSETSPLVFEDKSYPGLRISYKPDIGVSPEDEYFVHFDPETHLMTWLGYTVTYYSKEKSSNVKWIRYNDWKDVNGLLLPKSIDWYKLDEGKPTTLRNTVVFDAINMTKEKFEDVVFEKTPNAKIVDL